MTEMSCTYGDGRDEAIVAWLYDDSEWSPAQRGRFETHLDTCARCRVDVAALKGVRAQLAHWSPPAIDHSPSTISNPQSATRSPQWWSAIPAWAQVAAALLFLGVSAGIANLDVRYDRNGLRVTTGWAGRSDRAAGSDAAQPWKADIASLESQLKNELRATQAAAQPAPAVRAVAAAPADAEIARRVRALVEDSEKRQQRELALRIAELYRDVTADRKADMVKIDRTLGVVQNNVGIEVMKTRNQMDLMYRASQRQ